jgi:hypothetical protein
MKMGTEYWWNHIDWGKTEILEEKSLPLPLCSPKILIWTDRA